jgi:hypothetical protein
MPGGTAKATVRFLSPVLSLTKGSAEGAYRRARPCYEAAHFAMRRSEGRPFDTASASLRPTQEPPSCTLEVFGGPLRACTKRVRTLDVSFLDPLPPSWGRVWEGGRRTKAGKKTRRCILCRLTMDPRIARSVRPPPGPLSRGEGETDSWSFSYTL